MLYTCSDGYINANENLQGISNFMWSLHSIEEATTPTQSPLLERLLLDTQEDPTKMPLLALVMQQK